ncbi:hypothetical protein [Halomonas sp. MMSF_3323]|uniref:hypothetical protein n=1 Tax=Halomonas sp. MMSF_3323 TaxID=3046701 RepID=UPI00273F3695|nr:hypothetical protein [Halomonas sp. MMSF_3323]
MMDYNAFEGIPDAIIFLCMVCDQKPLEGLPVGVKCLGKKRYAPFYVLPSGKHHVVKKPRCRTPEEAHKYYQWLIIDAGQRSLGQWKEEPTFNLHLANYILHGILEPLANDWEAGRETVYG